MLLTPPCSRGKVVLNILFFVLLLFFHFVLVCLNICLYSFSFLICMILRYIEISLICFLIWRGLLFSVSYDTRSKHFLFFSMRGEIFTCRGERNCSSSVSWTERLKEIGGCIVGVSSEICDQSPIQINGEQRVLRKSLSNYQMVRGLFLQLKRKINIMRKFWELPKKNKWINKKP